MWRRKEPEPEQLAKHRGRIYKDSRGWWRYKCTDCGFGAGSLGYGVGAVPVFIRTATRHALERGPSLSSSSSHT